MYWATTADAQCMTSAKKMIQSFAYSCLLCRYWIYVLVTTKAMLSASPIQITTWGWY
jgi:hypothetical protein